MPSLPATAVLLSFEGPDLYAMVGGLGVRETELAAALGAAGTATTLVFVGDPEKPPVEAGPPNVEYRRWCQWLSVHHPQSVYDGERQKIDDYAKSAPPFVCDLVAAAIARGERPLVMAEEWHTAPAIIALDALLRARGLRDRALLVWNANNTYGFEMIDWPSLRAAATIMTISKYMKFELAKFGVDALVVPNGIPPRLLAGPRADLVADVDRAFAARPTFLKVGRFDPDKRWLAAIDALAMVRERHPTARLVARGGREPYAEEVFARARALGLGVANVETARGDTAGLLAAIAASTEAVINVRSFLEEPVLYAMYASADAVIANSGKEPFGLVGLEVMAAGGLAVTGSTGEEYVEPFGNAIACDTGDGRELADYLLDALADPDTVKSLRANGRATAARYGWPTVLRALERKLAFVEQVGAENQIRP